MSPKILFATPPFTQLNTPYPATAYLKGFLNTKGVASAQMDLGIEVILKLFSSTGLIRLFEALEGYEGDIDENIKRIFYLQNHYINTIDDAIAFLQDKNPTLAYQICERSFLPEASRFEQLDQIDWAFGSLGIRDKARHLVTLYLEDLSDLIQSTIDPHFGFSRYAERLALAAPSFDPLYEDLQATNSLVTEMMLEILEERIQRTEAELFCLSIPFPGNLFAGLKCGQYIKQYHPHIKIALGGGYANTELRSLAEERFFEFVDYVCLDDGEAVIWNLLEHLQGHRPLAELKRVFSLQHGVVHYSNGATEKDVPQRAVGTPDYEGLPIKSYLSVLEVTNPMHRLWSDGRWNKLTLAHGCYWGKCTFCDVTLDYIKNYEPITADLICDRIEQIIAQTGETGFHFVDEAAPPALMRDLAIELIRRDLNISWWTNIRFEKRFTADLCQLLKASGCIAVSGGLEVASDRLLTLIKKGVSVAQVAKVAHNFTQAGIMVHAYLMYGFPTQTAQETVNSLEMVRQMFELGIVQSGFWHRFAMTAHSPIGQDPAAFDVVNLYPEPNKFANNDLYHDDPKGCDHGLFSEGLRKSLFNYMNELGFDYELQEWFDFPIPATIIAPDFIATAIEIETEKAFRPRARLLYLHELPELVDYEENGVALAELCFYTKNKTIVLTLAEALATWLVDMLDQMHLQETQAMTMNDLKTAYEAAGFGTFQDFLTTDTWQKLRTNLILLI